MDRINEIGDTKKGQEMLGRTAERAYQRAQRTSGADKNRYMRTYNDAYKTGGKSSNKHLGGSREHFDNGRDYEYEKWADEHNGNVAESKTMNKKLIRLTESDLHKIVKESVNKIINEIGDTPKGQFMLGRAYRRAEKRGDKDTAVRASNKAWDGSEGGGRNYRNFKSGIDFQNDMDTDKAYKSWHKLLNHSVKESIDSFTSVLLPRKGWKTLATWMLNIEFNGELVYAIENRPENGEVFLLSNEGDGYHVIGYFSDLEPSQQETIKNLLMQKMGGM
jgi:hypothetical protein